MNRLVFLISLIFAQTVFAYQYIHYDRSKIYLSDDQFRRYVRPQIKNIVTEYYHILKKINPIQGDVIQLKNQIRELKYQWTNISSSCLKIKQSCTEEIKKFYGELRKLEIEILKFEQNNLNFKTKETTEETTYQLDLLLNLKKNLNDLSTVNYENLHIVEEIMIGHNTPILAVSETNHKQLNNNLSKILLTSELMISGQMDHSHRREFYFLFANFIKNLEKQIIRGQNKEYFLDRLGELNVAWNSFHMKMVKGHNKLPKKQAQIIIVMHNRWNSLLKLLLKR